MRNLRNTVARCILSLHLLLLSGCAATWVLDSEIASPSISWPDHSGEVQILHVTTFQGFKEIGRSVGSVLKRIAFGGVNGNIFIRPVAVAVGPQGRLAVADTGCKCVHLYIPLDRHYLRIDTAGSVNFESPVSITFDTDANLYVSDSLRRTVSAFDRKGAFRFSLSHTSNGDLVRPTGVVYSPETSTLFVVDTLGHSVCRFAADGTPRGCFGKRGAGTGEFNFPTHIARTPSGNIMVTDAMNFRVQAFTSEGSYLSSFGRHGDGSGDFAMPKGIAVDKRGVVYVVDSLFDNVQLFSMEGGFLFTLGNQGSGHGEFWLPSGLFLDQEEHLYVCDTYNQRIQIFRIFKP